MQKNSSLEGKTVILTRAQAKQSESRKIFESIGARVLDFPALIIGPPNEIGPLDDALRDLANFHWIIFSSANGVEAVEKRLEMNNMSLSDLPKTLKIAVVGLKTANSLNKIGVQADFVPPDFVADSLINNFPFPAAGLRILLPRVQSGGRTLLAEAFGKAGAHVLEVPAYESYCPQDIPEKTLKALDNFEVDAITFTSGKTVSHVSKLMKDYFGNNWKEKLMKVKLISIGPQTSLICEKYFQRVDKEAIPHTLEGLLNACIDSLKL